MVEAVMLWNEPNNLSHWDFKIDSEYPSGTSVLQSNGVEATVAPDIENGCTIQILRKGV